MPRPDIRPVLLIALGLIAVAPARALIVQDYTPAEHERFASGFATAPVANTSPEFLFSGYDLSGVGWRDNSPSTAVTLISPEHFLTAAHVAPAGGSTVSFLGADGVKRTYTVSTATTLTFNGLATDLTLGRLTAPVATAHITNYPGLFLGPSAATYEEMPVALYGANGRVGLNTVNVVGNFDMLPFGGGDDVVDSVVAFTTQDAVRHEAQGQGGDSGSPTFVAIAGGQLALWGIHSAIASVGATALTIDSLPLFTAYDQINAALQAAGYAGWAYYTGGVEALTAIPEPAAGAFAAGLGALGLLAGRRRRRPAPADQAPATRR